jgi:hypothetical protein
LDLAEYTRGMLTSVLAGLTPAQDAIFRYDSSTGQWGSLIAPQQGVLYRMTGGPFGLVFTEHLYGDSTWLHHPDRNILIAGANESGYEGYEDKNTYASTATAQYRLRADHQAVEEIDIYGGAPVPGGAQGSTTVGGPADSIVAHCWGLVAVEPTHKNLFQFQGQAGQWVEIGGPGAQFVVTGNALFGLTPNSGAVFQYEGSGNWTQVGGAYTWLAGGVWGLVATDSQGDLWHYEDQPNKWAKIGGPGYRFVVGDTTVYGLTPDRGVVNEFNPANGTWFQIGGPASEIVVYGESH